jgi:hypothetical protein
LIAGSHLTRDTDNLSSTQFATHDAQDHASLPLISWHAKPGDVIAFAGESVSDTGRWIMLPRCAQQRRNQSDSVPLSLYVCSFLFC